MSHQAKWEYFRVIYQRYRQANRRLKRAMLDEFCRNTGYHRKYAIRLLNGPPPARSQPPRRRRRRSPTYGVALISVLTAIGEAAGYPWSVRLKALLPIWMPWARQRFSLRPEVERQLQRISPRSIDYRLRAQKRRLKKRLYGRTKPGTLLKHHLPIKTDNWDVRAPGFTEIDRVSHSGNSAAGDYCPSLNLTDIHTPWVETRAVRGKGQEGVRQALEQMRPALPFALLGIDSDHGSEFIHGHLGRYCPTLSVQFTRGRPYKKDDNAHIEQKNWTHVRKLLGYERYDSPAALAAINDLYTQELRLFQNLFLPGVKLASKERIGSRLKRIDQAPQTPFERVCASPQASPAQVAQLKKLRDTLDPFQLSQTINTKLDRIFQPASSTSTLAVEDAQDSQLSTAIHRKKKEAKKKD